jgi:glycosyltransferase involved in cell wall biosynthesis
MLKKPLCLVVIMKNEQDYILEWVAYYRSIGVTHIFIYDNDSDDRTSNIIEKLVAANVIKSKRWSVEEGVSPQIAAYNDALVALRDEYEFLAFFDADEFLVPTGKIGIIDWLSLIRDDVGAIAINQRVFGSSGIKVKSSEPVIDRFRRAANPDYVENRWVKSIYRISSTKKILNPHIGELLSGRYITPDGRNAFSGFKNEGTAVHIDFSLFQLNHYILKSEEEFMEKKRRGGGAGATRQARIDRYEDMNFFHGRDALINTDIDGAAVARLPDVMIELDILKLISRDSGFAGFRVRITRAGLPPTI